jgi:uncharacterized protein (DUF58 family)
MKVPTEIIKKVKLIELRTRKLVNNFFAGEYQTKFRGQGMTFSDFREYVAGDDVRTISWSLTARAGKPYVKQFEEEREMTLIIAVDISASQDFGTGENFKGEVLNWLSALLLFSAEKNNDRIGLLLFSDRVEHYIPPKKGRGHVQRILRDLYYFKPAASKTSISVAINHLSGVLKKRATVFLMSDFFDSNYEKPLRYLGSKHEVIACVVQDPAESVLPAVGLMDLHDAETDEQVTVDFSDKNFRKQYETAARLQREARDKQLLRSQVDRIDIRTDKDITLPVIQYFKRRA